MNNKDSNTYNTALNASFNYLSLDYNINDNQ